MMGQMKLADRDFNVDAEVVFPSENLDDAPPRILRRRRPVSNLHIHHHAFQIIPLRPPRHLVAQHAIDRFFLPRRPP